MLTVSQSGVYPQDPGQDLQKKDVDSQLLKKTERCCQDSINIQAVQCCYNNKRKMRIGSAVTKRT